MKKLQQIAELVYLACYLRNNLEQHLRFGLPLSDNFYHWLKDVKPIRIKGLKLSDLNLKQKDLEKVLSHLTEIINRIYAFLAKQPVSLILHSEEEGEIVFVHTEQGYNMMADTFVKRFNHAPVHLIFKRHLDLLEELSI